MHGEIRKMDGRLHGLHGNLWGASSQLRTVVSIFIIVRAVASSTTSTSPTSPGTSSSAGATTTEIAEVAIVSAKVYA